MIPLKVLKLLRIISSPVDFHFKMALHYITLHLGTLMVLVSLGQALGAERPAGIQVFAVLLHAHLAGRAIRMRHFRNGEEQKLLAYDDEFDFNFQEFQYLKEERTILPVRHS